MAGRAVAIKRGRGGKLVSAKSKTGDPACSQAMSDWKRNGMTAAVAAILGKCRSKAHHLRRASDQRMAGREARAQSIEHKVDRGLTAKERTAKAKELVAKRREGRAEKPRAAEKPRSPVALRQQAESHRAKRGLSPVQREMAASSAKQMQALDRGDDARFVKLRERWNALDEQTKQYRGSAAIRHNPTAEMATDFASGIRDRARAKVAARRASRPSVPARVEPPRPSLREQAATTTSPVDRLRDIQNRATSMEPKDIDAAIDDVMKNVKGADVRKLNEDFLGVSIGLSKRKARDQYAKRIHDLRAWADRAKQISQM